MWTYIFIVDFMDEDSCLHVLNVEVDLFFWIIDFLEVDVDMDLYLSM